jgi:clan AA aspartic protease (TIGR02281 family)
LYNFKITVCRKDEKMNFLLKNNLFAIALFFSTLFLALPPPCAVAQDIYKWVDDKGIIHLSDYPPDVPPAYRRDIQIIREYPAPDVEDTIIPFERSKSGLMVINAVLNGNVDAKMIFDTGSDSVIITSNLAKRLSRKIEGGEKVILHTDRGEIGASTFTINRLELGGIAEENVPAVISPDQSYLTGFDGLLGLDIWKDFKVTIDYRNNSIRISSGE